MSAAFDHVISYQKGIWLLRLYSDVGNEVDNVVLLDAIRGVILDPTENYAVSATVESLRACAGPDVQCLQLAEVLELYKR